MQPRHEDKGKDNGCDTAKEKHRKRKTETQSNEIFRLCMYVVFCTVQQCTVKYWYRVSHESVSCGERIMNIVLLSVEPSNQVLVLFCSDTILYKL